MKKALVLTFLLSGLLLLISCTEDIPPTSTAIPQAELPPTETAVPEPTPIPPTFTPEPTIAPTETAIPTEEPVVVATAETAVLSESEMLQLNLWQEGQLNPEYTVSDEREGACWIGSLAANRPDAWRCATQEGSTFRILDPCFANLQNPEGELACLNSDSTLTLLTLQTRLPEEFANDPGLNDLPLKVILDDGNECGLLLGATITVPLNGEEQRVNYTCTEGGILVGLPNKANDIWTIAYNSDPLGDAEFEDKQIVQAFAFNGDTASIGGASVGDGGAQIVDINIQNVDSIEQIVFQFDSANFPAFEAGYVNEPYETIPEGAKVLRFLFSYPVGQTPTYESNPELISEYPEHINQILLVTDNEHEIGWAAGLDEMVGFTVTRSAEDQTVTLNLYGPVPNATNRPDLGVGSSGEDVRAVQALLFALGYLEEMPEEAKYNEPTRKAVVAYQADHGIIPDGVVGAETWASFERDVPDTNPAPNTAVSPQNKLGQLTKPQNQETPQVVPNSSAGVNVHSGPGLDYPTIAVLPAGQPIDAVGIIEGSSPTTTWVQVCCVNGDQAGWVRGDVVRLDGSTAGMDGASADYPIAGDPTTPEVVPSNRPSHTPDGQPILYFTFDDGPEPVYTPLITDAMQEFNGLGAFFNIGQNAATFPDVIQTASEKGFSIQNHTYHHASLDEVTPTEFYNEVENTQVVIYDAIGIYPICLRPPYGATTQETFDSAAELGLEIAMWDIDTQDWRRPGTAALVEHIMDSVFPGAIILMHDGGGDRSQTVEALQQTLPQLQAEGYVFNVLCQ